MLKNAFLLLLFATTAFTALAQEETFSEVLESETTIGDVPFSVIEKVPIYPGCDGNSNVELKKCMSTKIAEFVNMHFDMKKIEALKLPPKIYRTAVQFKIDKQGKVIDVRARAPRPEIENEAVRVVSNLPKMEPGKQKGEAVGVLYSLPIIFKIEPPIIQDKKRKKRKGKN